MQIYQIYLLIWFCCEATSRPTGFNPQQPYVKWAIAQSYSWVVEPSKLVANYGNNFDTLSHQEEEQARQAQQQALQRAQQQVILQAQQQVLQKTQQETLQQAQQQALQQAQQQALQQAQQQALQQAQQQALQQAQQQALQQAQQQALQQAQQQAMLQAQQQALQQAQQQALQQAQQQAMLQAQQQALQLAQQHALQQAQQQALQQAQQYTVQQIQRQAEQQMREQAPQNQPQFNSFRDYRPNEFNRRVLNNLETEYVTPSSMRMNEVSNPHMLNYNQDFIDRIVEKVIQKTRGSSNFVLPTAKVDIEKIVREILLEYSFNASDANRVNVNQNYENPPSNKRVFHGNNISQNGLDVFNSQNAKPISTYPIIPTEQANPQVECIFNCGNPYGIPQNSYNNGEPIAIAIANTLYAPKRSMDPRILANSFTYTSV